MEKATGKAHQAIVKEIRALARECERAFNNVPGHGFSNGYQRLRDLCMDEERRHRGFCRGRGDYRISKDTAADLFAVRRLLACVYGEEGKTGAQVRASIKGDLANFWHYQRSIYGACALALDPKVRAEIRQRIPRQRAVAAIEAFDYSRLV